MTTRRQMYQQPDFVELGEASTLTLGTLGCKADAWCCDYKVPDPE
jgi:hypothetical protein